MEVCLYVGEVKKHLDYYTDFFTTHNYHCEIDHGYFGYKIKIKACNIDELSEHICRFIFDFYLKEAVISKMYDEYPCFSTEEASIILTKISDRIINTPIKDHIYSIISEQKSFNPESYSLFNLKSVMVCIYALTDDICNKMIYDKEKEQFISMIKTFSKLSFEKCSRVDVEFSKDDNCIVSVDKDKPIVISGDEILSFLAQKAPENINIKNSFNNPDLAGIVSEIFTSQKNNDIFTDL